MALNDNLIAYWKLDEASGSRADSHSTNTLTDSTSTGSAAGKIGLAADFELGSNNFLTIADNVDLSTGDIDFTMTCWLNMESQAAIAYILGKYNTTGNQRAYTLVYVDSTDRLTWRVSNNGTAVVDTTADNFGAVPTATWMFVVMWHDATANAIGIQVNNGTANTTAHTTGVFDGTSAFQIGARVGSTTDDYDGLVDEVGFWKRILTADEKTALYNAGAGLSYPFSSVAAIASRRYYEMQGAA